LRANKPKQAQNFILHICKDLKIDLKQKFKIKEQAVYGVAAGISTVFNGAFWNIEKFIKGEVESFLSKKEHLDNLELSELILTNALDKLLSDISYDTITSSKFPEKSYLRVANEAIFRLGEIYILFEGGKKLPQHKETVNKLLTNKLKPIVLEYFKKEYEDKDKLATKIDFLNEIERVGTGKITDSQSIFCLNYSYYFASILKDEHRKADSLQSIANARYFNGLVLLNKGEFEGSLLDSICKKVTDICVKEGLGTVKETVQFPVVMSKMELVIGDVYFSLYKDTIKNTKNNAQIKPMVHEFNLHYLLALNYLTDPNKPYQNYHFNNMNYEIERRILQINDKNSLHYLSEDMETALLMCERLQQGGKKKDEFAISFEKSILTQEIALDTQNLFQ
jgi:hypothetical protein